jgi:hypothetical protein
MRCVKVLSDGETGLNGSVRPGGEDLEHSGTSQDDGNLVPVRRDPLII